MHRVPVDHEGTTADLLAAEPHVLPLADGGADDGVGTRGGRPVQESPERALVGIPVPWSRLDAGRNGPAMVGVGGRGPLDEARPLLGERGGSVEKLT